MVFARSLCIASLCIASLCACTTPLATRDTGAPTNDVGFGVDADDLADSGADAALAPDSGLLDAGVDAALDAEHDGGPDAGPSWGLAPDPAFGSAGVAALNGGVLDAWNASSCAVADDGSVVVAGSTDAGHALFVRLTASGTLDTSFGAGGSVERSYGSAPDAVRDVFVLADGRVAALEIGDQNRVVRLTSSGAADTTFDSDGIVTLSILGVVVDMRAIDVTASGRVAVAGRVWESAVTSSRHDFLFALYRADGSLDPAFDADGVEQLSFSPSTDEEARTIAFSAPDDVVFGGAAATDSHAIVGRIADTGVLDASFGSAGTVLSAGETGSVAIAAFHSAIVHASDTFVARLLVSGAPDTAFGGGAVAFGGRTLRSMIARDGTDVWVACTGEPGLRGVDWSGAPRGGGELLAVPSVAIASGFATDVEVTHVCTGGGGAIVAVGETREHASGTARGIFVARFVGP